MRNASRILNIAGRIDGRSFNAENDIVAHAPMACAFIVLPVAVRVVVVRVVCVCVKVVMGLINQEDCKTVAV